MAETSPLDFLHELIAGNLEGMSCGRPTQTDHCSFKEQMEELVNTRVIILDSLVNLFEVLQCSSHLDADDQNPFRTNFPAWKQFLAGLLAIPVEFSPSWSDQTVAPSQCPHEISYPEIIGAANIATPSRESHNTNALPTPSTSPRTRTSECTLNSQGTSGQMVRNHQAYDQDGDIEMLLDETPSENTSSNADIEENIHENDDMEDSFAENPVSRLAIQQDSEGQDHDQDTSFNSLPSSCSDEQENGYPSVHLIQAIVASYQPEPRETKPMDNNFIHKALKRATNPTNNDGSPSKTSQSQMRYLYGFRDLKSPKLAVKIGQSKDPFKRRQSLQNECKPSYLERISHPEREPVERWCRRAEHIAHLLLEGSKIVVTCNICSKRTGQRSEYFVIDDATAQEAIDFAMDFTRTVYEPSTGQITSFWKQELLLYQNRAPRRESTSERVLRWKAWFEAAQNKREEENRWYRVFFKRFPDLERTYTLYALAANFKLTVLINALLHYSPWLLLLYLLRGTDYAVSMCRIF